MLIKRWISRHSVAFVVTVIVVLSCALLTDEGYEAEFCPICGHSTLQKGIRVLGIPLSRSNVESHPCLLPDHRFFLKGASWSFWWKDGYNHATGYANQWSRNYRMTLGPWLEARRPSDPDRERVLAALAQASPEQIDELLGNDQFWLWEDIAVLMEPPFTSLAERWGREFLLPWAETVHGRVEDR